MVSGNFLIGSGLKMEGFVGYFIPAFNEAGITVLDRLTVPYESYRTTILVSLSGELSGDGDLEKAVNAVLVKSGCAIEADMKKKREENPNYKHTAWKHEVSEFSHWERDDSGKLGHSVEKGEYETLGVYQENNTASQLFPLIAQKYLAQDAKKGFDKLTEQIKEIGDKLAKMSS